MGVASNLAQVSIETEQPRLRTHRPENSHLSVKSPLRYPGGKTRAVDLIRSYIPSDVKELAAPFLGGGSVELSCAADGIRVFGSDAFGPLMNFWKHAKANAESLAQRVSEFMPLSKAKYYSLQRTFARLDDEFEQAAVFFVLNRSSFSGTTLSGGMSPGHPRFNDSAIDRLHNFRTERLFLRCSDYREALKRHETKFLYLDPPYANGERLYGAKGDMHEGFDHQELADILKQRDGWILTYNDSGFIRDLYRGYDLRTPEWSYGMSNGKKSEELFVINT